MTTHAVLSASAADRWLHCPPSARMEKRFPDKGSPYAAEGTLAHALAALKLEKLFYPMSATRFEASRKRIIETAKARDGVDYDREMDRYTDIYMDEIDRVACSFPSTPFVSIENKVYFSAYVPGGYGTADCIMISGQDLHIFDLKYGKNVKVAAKNNNQLRLYALGAYLNFGMIYPIKIITQHIIQPRVDDGISSWSYHFAELDAWAESIRETARLADAGQGELDAGPWCQFCKAKPVCRKYGEQFKTAAVKKPDPKVMQPDEIGKMLRLLDGLVSYQKELKDFALSEALKGHAIPGMKVVEGRSVRAWKDQDAAFKKVMTLGFKEPMLYERVPLSLSSVEKLVGKKQFGLQLKDYVVKPRGKPTLVPVSDNRPEFSPHSAIDDFKDVSLGGKNE